MSKARNLSKVDVSSTVDVTANSFIGDGSQLTGISGGSASLGGTAVDSIDMNHFSIENAVMNPCPEGKLSAAPYLINDFGYNRQRGGAVVSVTNATITDAQFDAMFDPKASTWEFNNTAADETGAMVLK